MPKATSSPSISDEQKERMIRNRKLAEERRLARLKQNTTINLVDKSNSIEEEPIMINDTVEERSNINNDVQNNDLVIEIREKDTNMSDTEVNINTGVKKINRSNVIDSDEESDAGNNLVIDMTEQSELSPKKGDTRKNMSDTEGNIDKARVKNMNRSNAIDSDEESDGNNLVIDMAEQSELSRKKADKRKNKSNIINSDDETNVVDTDKNNLVIDMTEEINNQTKLRPFSSNTVDFVALNTKKSKNSGIDVIDKDMRVEEKRNEQNNDSSDDENMTVIQSISVDVHINRNHDTNFNAKITEATTNISGDNDVIETEYEMNGITEDVDRNETGIKDKDDIENIETNNVEERVEVQKDLKEKAKEVETNYKDVNDKIGKEIDGNSKIQDEKENIDRNVLQNEEVQELMDVDFSDDF